MRKFSKPIDAFTMLELMIVVSVIGILTVVLLPRFQGVKDGVRESTVDANMYAVEAVCQRLIDDYDDPVELGKAILEALDGELENPYSESDGVLFAYTTNGVTISDEGNHTSYHNWKTGKTNTTSWAYSDDGKPAAVQLWISNTQYNAEYGSFYYFASDGNTTDSAVNIFPSNSTEVEASKGAVIIAITKKDSGSTLWGSNIQINLFAFDGETESMTLADESPTIIQIR